MKRRFAVIILGLLAGTGVALADGGMFLRRSTYNQRADILQPTQKVYIRWDGSQERLLIQTKYEGPAEEMVWIVPVPAQPMVEKGDAKVFERLSTETATPDISLTQFVGLFLFPTGSTVSGGGRRSGSSGSSASPVEWRRQIGEYDVVLLRPAGEENVILWLNGNGFGLPEDAVPILQDYIRDGWWMVAAKIDPNALTAITRDKLASGTLHPLEMTFESSACLYPLRLTSMAAGPVEELIYIEGPTHYEPVTFADDGWQIDVFGGPLRIVPDAYRMPDIESTMEITEGRVTTIPKRHLTKLRRVFQPEEMTQDILFGPVGYAKLAARGEPLRIAQMATQYGRHRDPNGIPHVLNGLSAQVLLDLGFDDAMRGPSPYSPEVLLEQVRSCMWALGEIGMECEVGDSAEEVLLQCAHHDLAIIRMDSYIALAKVGSEELGPILVDRFAQALSESSDRVVLSYPGYTYWDASFVRAEMDIVADWILYKGTEEQRDVVAEGVKELIAKTPSDLDERLGGPQRSTPVAYNGAEWLMYRAACTEDDRMIAGLRKARSRLAGTDAFTAINFLQRAEAACGSSGSKGTVVRDIREGERRIVPQGQATPVANIISLSYGNQETRSPREQVLAKRELRYELYPMSPEVSDATLRAAISAGSCCDWYVLYLLAGIKHPQAEDSERLLGMWQADDVPTAIVIVDVLYVWGDWQTLMDFYEQTPSPEVRSEIAWALAELSIPEAAAIVDEQIRGSWNPLWLGTNWSFPRLADGQENLSDPKAVDAVRTAEAAWRYFHPEFRVLNNDSLTSAVIRPKVLEGQRLAVLKGLVADHDIHEGMRFDLVGSDYATTDWGRSIIKEAAAKVLQSHPDAPAVRTIASQTSDEFVVDICGESLSDESQRDLLISLLASGDGYYLTVIEALLWEVWPERYIQTEGQSSLFGEPGDLAASIDYYCWHALSALYPRMIEAVLSAIIHEDSLPAGYRAFLLIHWPTAHGSFTREFVEDLLQEDMPEFIREALQQRLADWPWSW